MADNPNPGNFANRPRREVQDIGHKGGQHSHAGGFASMDPGKQVRLYPPYGPIISRNKAP